MKKHKKEEINKKFQTIYYEYFTDYLLFSEVYSDLIEQGKLDEFIKAGYVYRLYDMVDKNKEENIYPSLILDNFIELVALLNKRSEEIEDEKTRESTGKLYLEILAHLAMTRDDDQTEIYYLEYIKRYSTLKDIDKMKYISVANLEVDIQKDFKYLSILNDDVYGKEEEFGEDFYSFLNKLFIDFPEINEYPFLRENIKHVLKYKSDEKSKHYIDYLNNKNEYVNNIGFSIETFEVLYASALIQKIIFNQNAKEELEKIDPNYLFTIPIYYCLSMELEVYIETGRISKIEKEQLSDMISILRENLKEYGGIYKKDFNALINEWIIFFNKVKPQDEVRPIYSTAVLKTNYKKSEWIFGNLEKEQAIMAKMNEVMTKCFDMLNYFISKEDFENSDDEITLLALNFLFHDYPKMFFDEEIYKKTCEILDSVNSSQKLKIKNKINQVRKG